jgi:imidazole glycerol phosphate synthase subunit HisF
LLNSIDKDGLMEDYDIDLIKKVSSEVNIPIIVSGGCGCLQDFVGDSTITAEEYMKTKGLKMRTI